MVYVAKSAPAGTDTGDRLTIRERAMYGGDAIRAGDVVFLWASETQGGEGLWARGTVLRRLPDRQRVTIETSIDRRRTGEQFSTRHLEPYRNATGTDPLIGLSRKLYRHAHNKIARLSDDEASLLGRYFD